jgi:hypothetical protein
MPRGSKTKYSSKQKRKAQQIEEGYEKRGTPKGEAERRAWATVNKQEGGAKARRTTTPRKRASSTGRRGTTSRTRTTGRRTGARKTSRRGARSSR